MISKLIKFSPIFNQFAKFSQLKQVYRKRISSVGVLGAPIQKGQAKYGVEQGPDVLRNWGLIQQLKDLDLDIKDFGNIKLDSVCCSDSKNACGNLIYPLEIGAACQKVSDAVKEILLEGRKCVTLGGDHSLGMGTVHGHSLVHDICVLWVDAHADINTPVTSLSGYMHGMPLSFLIKEMEKYQNVYEGFEWLKPCVKKENLAFIGLRDIDPLEKLILTKENILHFTMRDIDELGIVEVTKRALKAINPMGELSLHVSFDVDSIDTLIVPCTGTPVPGGLTVREALCIAEEISNLDSFRALDIVEVNPALGNKEQLENTLAVATLLTKTFLGYSRQGSAPMRVHEIPVA